MPDVAGGRVGSAVAGDRGVHGRGGMLFGYDRPHFNESVGREMSWLLGYLKAMWRLFGRPVLEAPMDVEEAMKKWQWRPFKVERLR